jgi:hypothetical protein
MLLSNLNDGSGLRHLERAVQLDPNNAEAWYWLYQARERQLDFGGALVAIRRTAELDPFWVFSSYFAAEAWDMGLRTEAQQFEQRVAANHPNPFERETARWRMAWHRNDWSSAYGHALRAREIASRNMRHYAGEVLMRLGLFGEAERFVPPQIVSLFGGQPPPNEDLRRVFPDPMDFWLAGEAQITTMRLLLKSNRPADLLYFYDRAFRSPEVMAESYPDGPAEFIEVAPSIAIALRQVGREAEASRLMALADQRVRAALRQPRIPLSFQILCARLWAASGRTERALQLFERAVAAGWRPEVHEARQLADEPVLSSIAGSPRLRRLDAMIAAEIARERTQLSPLLRGQADEPMSALPAT